MEPDGSSGCTCGMRPQEDGAPERDGGHASVLGGVHKRIDGGGSPEEHASGAHPVTGAVRLMVHDTDFDPCDSVGGGGYGHGGGQSRVRGHPASGLPGQAALLSTSALARRRRTAVEGMAGAGRPGSSMWRRRSNCAKRYS